MAASRFIEEESGIFTRRFRRRQDGYYAGDFSQAPPTVPDLRATLSRLGVVSAAGIGTSVPSR